MNKIHILNFITTPSFTMNLILNFVNEFSKYFIITNLLN